MKFRKYESLKARVQNIGLSPRQFELVLQVLAEALGL